MRTSHGESFALRASSVISLETTKDALCAAVPEFWQQFPKDLNSANIPICIELPTRGGWTMEYNVYKDTGGLWRWQLVDANKVVIAESAKSYETENECLAQINDVKGSWYAPVSQFPQPVE